MDYTIWNKGVDLYAAIIKEYPNVANTTRIAHVISPYTGSDEEIAVIISTINVLSEFSSEAMTQIIEIVETMGGHCSISVYNNKPAVYLY